MNTDPVEFVVKAINDSGLEASAHGQVPNPRPDEFVRVVLTGTGFVTPIHWDSLVTIEVWAQQLPRAYELACGVMREIEAAETSWAGVSRFDGWVGGPAPVPDPDSGTPRVVMTCTLRHKVKNG